MRVETKHTPGPWETLGQLDGVNIGGHPHTVWPIGSQGLIGTGIVILPNEDRKKDTIEYCNANAKLMATSPELLQQHVQDIEHLQGVMELVDSEVKTILAAMISNKQALVQKATTV